MSNKTDKPKIMIFVARYLPGFKAGGPLRTIAAMVEHCADEFDFNIITGDRDAGEQKPYPGIKVDSWNQVGKAKVFYLPPVKRTLRYISSLLNRNPYDLLYLNSFFNHRFTGIPLLAHYLKKIPRKPILLAPRGEFSAGAMTLQAWKKRPYLITAKLSGICGKLAWQASSEYEKEDIVRIMGPGIKNKITIAPDLSLAYQEGKNSDDENTARRIQGAPLKIISLARITPVKNIDLAIRILKNLEIPVEYNIYGPVDEEEYWRRCQEIISLMPANVKTVYHGTLSPEKVLSTIAQHDLFLLLTKSENYGHAIAESLAAGTPVLISDTTPWRHLEQAGAGWDLPLDDEQAFIEKIKLMAFMSPEKVIAMRKKTRDYARKMLADPSTIEANRQLLKKVIAKSDNTLNP